MGAESRLAALSLPGLSPDSLGNYLASLGLLRVLSRKWTRVRIAWDRNILRVVGGPSTLDELLDELVRVATSREWTAYERGWLAAQMSGTKLGQSEKTRARAGLPVALWRADASENVLEILDAHVVATTRLSFNPLTGKGGSAGNRDFSDGWKRATSVLASGGEAERRSHLDDLLQGRPIAWLVDEAPLEGKKKKGLLNAASWFSASNKQYNSGQRPAREGGISPWAMALACEGLSVLAGSASRRLGARSKILGAFPFVTFASAPTTRDEAGRDSAEFWAPLWDRPMTLAEIRSLFARGRAEQHGRGALTPASFASAITSRGIDAGISEFHRFTLGRTTSANTFEPRFEGAYVLQEDNAPANTNTATALERITALIEQPRFPRDRKVGQRWRAAGVRGPIEAALLRVAAQPNDHEAAIAMLDAVVASLDRIDRNRSFRKDLRWEPLPVEWVPSLFGGEPPGEEARLALSLVSGFPAALPLAVYRFGVEWKGGRFQHTERPPARWVWGPGELARVLSRVLARRILEEEAVLGRDVHESSGRAPLPATCSQLSHWLDGDVDELLLARWISRLALFEWRAVPVQVRDLAKPASLPPQVDGALSLFGLLQPLIDRRPVVMRGSPPPKDLFAPDTGARTSGVARSLASLVRAGSLDAALRIAGSRFAMAGAFLARTDAFWATESPERIVASFLFTITDLDRTVFIERWLRPRRRQQGDATHG